ncbi:MULTISPECIES: hypothetical protein [Vibrio harveyi group]|uniref:hypothetical protein n=1 Tax=Vibrio harveyi group TaxID=717610 RepID=UPI00111DD438|nr:hypothetical protein [Vibrio parahaemolyticus]MDF4677305.1 hypothetical protein [Vibrio parahaemolyticus]MDF4701463.1 hypothetical protein [Vibrio parahaemolyticus]TON06479.1 hypothetical protein CGH63_24630 [Vibrio parahaemolyticus]TOO32016.1 hypothetical protein CGH39_23535 [Vibrio parahaemolyticus]TOP23587.1 hypothetical protein CGH20_23600 [Vibrio parahaemolyticus]
MNFVYELLYVLSLSKRTQLALIFGVVFHFVILLVGKYYIAEIEFQGVMKPLEEAMVGKLLHKYDKVALFALASFWVLAFKCYRKDRKRLYRL